MLHDHRILLSVVLAGAALVYGVFLFPPLTTGGNASVTGLSQTKFDAVISQELTYCRGQPNDINCQCFVKLSAAILAHNEPRVPGAVYVGKRQLARGQAANAC